MGLPALFFFFLLGRGWAPALGENRFTKKQRRFSYLTSSVLEKRTQDFPNLKIKFSLSCLVVSCIVKEQWGNRNALMSNLVQKFIHDLAMK